MTLTGWRRAVRRNIVPPVSTGAPAAPRRSGCARPPPRAPRRTAVGRAPGGTPAPDLRWSASWTFLVIQKNVRPERRGSRGLRGSGSPLDRTADRGGPSARTLVFAGPPPGIAAARRALLRDAAVDRRTAGASCASGAHWKRDPCPARERPAPPANMQQRSASRGSMWGEVRSGYTLGLGPRGEPSQTKCCRDRSAAA